MSIRRHLRLTDKLILLTACGVAATLFLSVGWLAVAPTDPQGAVSLLTHENPVLMVVEAFALAAVTASLATLIAGSRLPDVGMFAVALGLTLASLRGGTATHLLLTISSGDRGAERLLAGQLAGEALIWSGVLMLSMVICGLTTRHFRPIGMLDEDESVTSPGMSGPVQLAELSVTECPFVNRKVGMAFDSGRPIMQRFAGLKTTVVTVVVAMFAFNVLVSGRLPHAIKHGQVIFAASMSFFLGVWASKQWFSCRTAFWSLLAVPVVAVLGYSWAVSANATGGMYADLANVPMSDFLRALPITFVASGSMGVLVARWWIHDAVSTPKKSAKSKKPKRRQA